MKRTAVKASQLARLEKELAPIRKRLERLQKRCEKIGHASKFAGSIIETDAFDNRRTERHFFCERCLSHHKA